MLGKNILRKFVCSLTAIAVLCVYSSWAIALPNTLTGEITVSGQVTVNGQTAVSNSTVISGSTSVTGANDSTDTVGFLPGDSAGNAVRLLIWTSSV